MQATAAATEQPRGNGGRFGPKPAAPAAPAAETATAYFARLTDLRARQGFIVLPPAPIAEFNRIRVRVGRSSDPTETDPSGSNREDARLLRLMQQWLRETADAGLSHDLWRVWQAWSPTTAVAKRTLRTYFDGLEGECRRKEFELRQRLEVEERPERIRREAARMRADNAARFAVAQEAYDKAKAEYERMEAYIDRQLAASDEVAA